MALDKFFRATETARGPGNEAMNLGLDLFAVATFCIVTFVAMALIIIANG